MQARWFWLLPAAAVASAIGAAVWFGTPRESGMPVSGGEAELRVVVVARHAHDPAAFTQGLVWHAGKVYETTGLYGQSRLRRWDLETGEIEQEATLAPDLFGEGLALVGSGVAGELIWLTWKAGRALRFDLDGFANLGEFSYQGEGWGLAFCNGELLRSDGTSTLWRHDPETFSVRGRFEVSRSGVAVRFLNELECTPRGLLANVWQRDQIVRIDPMSGRVTAAIDAAGLLDPEERRPDSVLNGIAYRPETDTLLITGKNWPWLFEVVLEES